MTKEEFWEHKKKLLFPDQRSYRSFELGVRYGEQQNKQLKAQTPQWHDLRKDPNDLPKDDKQYLVLYYYNYKGKKEMSYGVRDNLQSDFEIHRNYTEQIIAWCEIPQFKE